MILSRGNFDLELRATRDKRITAECRHCGVQSDRETAKRPPDATAERVALTTKSLQLPTA
jgi:hypothetical protein